MIYYKSIKMRINTGGIFLILLILMGSFFFYSVNIREAVNTTRTIETNHVIEDEKSYIDDTISSYFDIDDEN